MAFNKSISLQEYVDAADQRFSESESRLSEIEGSFETRMNGKTVGGLIGAMIGTAVWLVVFFAAFFVCYMYGPISMDDILCLVYLGVTAAMIIVLFIDEIIGISYYGKFSSYKNSIFRLEQRVSVGRSSSKSNLDAFMKSRANGWRHPLSVGTSINEEAASIERTIAGMESLKGGFINGVKNVLYFTCVVVITGIGGWVLFDVAQGIIDSILNSLDVVVDDAIIINLCAVVLVIVEIGMVILAKMWWSHNDCSVTNITLMIVPLGPVLFLTLVAVLGGVVVLIKWAIAIALVVAAVAIAGACVCGASSGG